MKIILASMSPRRKELLNQVNIPFEVMASNLEESAFNNENVEEYVKRLAFEKANDIFYKTSEDRIIIGADTIVWFDNKVLGKPKNEEDAFDMLKKLQSNKCIVFTGIAVICSKDNVTKIYNETSKCEIYMDKMTDEEINEYIKTGEPMDKAGSFAIQGIAAKYIKRVEGDYYATVGLPINRIYKIIEEIKMN